MKKLLCVLLIVATILTFTACSVTLPVAVTSNNVGTKCGTSTLSLGGNTTQGAFGIDAAARAAGIKKISHVDIKISFLEGDSLLAVTTLVYGE